MAINVNGTATELTKIARAVDPNVTGVGVLEPRAVARDGWTVVTRADGLRLRVDTVGGPPTQAVVDAILDADVSLQGNAARADAENPEQKALRDLVAQAVQSHQDFLSLGEEPSKAAVDAEVRLLAQQNIVILKRLAQLSEHG